MNNSLSNKKTRPKVVVIGLDGTPHSFLKREMDAGNLPHMASLAHDGAFQRMFTEIPTISSVAWASFMTGKNPGEHGIFGFTDRKPGTYDLYFPNYSHLKAEPIWDRLTRENKRCCVINVPSTYPARQLNGVMVSGFVAPSLERATYPKKAFDYLEDMGYRIDVDAAKARESLDLLLEDLYLTLDKRREAMFHFWRQEKWDLFVSVFTGTDRLHHFMWHHYENHDPTYEREFIKYYQRLDEIVGEFVEEISKETRLFMLSDHGFCSVKKLVFLNAWLSQNGYLAFKTDRPVTIADIDPERTRAYCLDPGRIYVNLKGREPSGTVSGDADYRRLIDQLEASLLELKDPENGEPMVHRVHKGTDLFSGPMVPQAPDLVVDPVRGYDFKGAMRPDFTEPVAHLTGMHTYDDAFIYCQEETDLCPSHIRDIASMLVS